MKKLFTLLTMLVLGIGSMLGQTNPSVISINFASGQTGGNFSGTGGLVPVGNWNNCSGASNSTGVSLNKSDGTASGATVTFSCKNTWTYNSNIKDNWLVGYLDDGNEISIVVSNIPYTNYSLIIYQATDTEGYGFNPPSINGTYYSWDGSKTSETRNDTELKYGSSRNKYAMLGVNTMYLKNFTNNTLTIRGGGNDNSARGCIAAIQIVEEVDGNTLYPSSVTQITDATSLTASKYYLIEGKDQSNNWYYLYDNGTKIQGNLLNRQEIGKYVWQLIGKDNAWVLKNIGTGKYMSLGSSNGSQISSSDKAQINSLYFAGGNATILNSNGQAIDMTANGLTPTTWTGDQTPAGSRSLHIYETNLFATDLEAYKSSITEKVDLQKNVSVLFSDDDYTTYTTSVESATSVAEADDAYAKFMESPGTDIFAVSSRTRGNGAPHYIKMSSQTTINLSEKVTNNTVYQLTHIGDGNYLFYNSETNGYWGKVETRNGAIPGAADFINAGFYRVEWNSTDNGRGDHINLKNINTTTDYFYVHESTSDKVVDWNPDSEASKWTIEAAASRSDILEGYNTYVGLLTTISDYEWKTADYWQLADGVTWTSDGPGYSMWQPIYLNGITASGIAFDGWNLSLKLVNSSLTATTGKFQHGSGSKNEFNVDGNSSLDLTMTGENNDPGTHTFNIDGSLTIKTKSGHFKQASTNNINLGTTGKFKFNADAAVIINASAAFNLCATLSDPSSDNNVESRDLATFTNVTVTTLTTSISGTDGWTQVYSQEDLSTQPTNGKYYYVEKTALGVTLKTYNETSKKGYTVSAASETLSEIDGSYDYYIIPEGKTLTIDEANFDLRKITGAGTVALAANTALTENNSTSATGMLKINEGITLSVESTNTSIVSFSNLTVNGTLHISTIPSTIVLSGAGEVKLTTFPTSSAPTVTSWTGTFEFASPASGQANLAAIFNAWGNANSTIKLHSVTGWLPGLEEGESYTVNPTLEILEGQTLTINNGSSNTQPLLNTITGAGTLEQTWAASAGTYELHISKLTGFTGTLKGTNKPIVVDKLVVADAPDEDALLIKTSGTVTLNKLYIGLQSTEAYSWGTKTVGEVTGIYVTSVDPVQLARESAVNTVAPYYNFIGTGVGKYTISLGYDKYNSIEDFLAALDAWSTVYDYKVPIVTINQPTSAFYRIKSGDKYLQDARKSNSDTQRTLTDAAGANESAETIFYLDNNKFIGYKTGYGFGFSVCQTQDTEHLNTQLFTESAEMGKYTIQSQQGTCSEPAYNEGFWGVDESDLSRKADAASGACWKLEPATSVPVTFKKAGLGYATLYTPVALQIPENTNAYVCKLQEAPNNAYTLTFYEITAIKDESNHTTIPANTAVLLYRSGVKDGEEDVVVNFPITTCKDEEGEDVVITENSFYGTLATKAFDPNSTEEDIYSLRTYLREDQAVKVGFYKKTTGTTCAGFKAWIKTDHPVNDEVRNIIISFDGVDNPTGIVEALGLENANVEIYDLNGRKMATYKKGINIVNGKKVLVK